jgi:hypothetical protein
MRGDRNIKNRKSCLLQVGVLTIVFSPLNIPTFSSLIPQTNIVAHISFLFDLMKLEQ